ncbi:cryptochrome/photolyase family protein [Alkalicaulis satelles]|uniref:Cryptochrome/photolyase family protein n=1 Tax=Alkalicaulis satelles TaxID=2609175 RepID=A0A5M6ZLV4_9PROT|nr:cryptochrome/photolyase family protein [Alkalicaulis satelles]KAA5804905.1 cryptochrome/photolyase family protein [Alkalicaulis satelles]
MSALRLILGDQLTRSLASLRDYAPGDTVLMAEVAEEAGYAPHHRKKIAFIFSAMRHFAKGLEDEGLDVRYVHLDAPGNTGSLEGEARRALLEGGHDRLIVVEPGEYRLMAAMKTWTDQLGAPVEIRRDDRFICTHERFDAWAQGRKRLTMEYFYREMRRETGLLMEGDEPAGGQWNFDSENRKRLPEGLDIPERLKIAPDPVTREVLALVEAQFPDRFGDLEDFWYAVTAEDAEAQLDWFIDRGLENFGDYQDAMKAGEAFLFHSVLSLYINCGLLDPLTVCRRAEEAWIQGRAPLNAVEGFIRQILGWREYVRGVYWRFMPEYLERNVLEARRPLPDFYWTGETEMACVRDCVLTTKRHAYAHHIQRLMITGNFALLAGIDPAPVNEWYLAVYADAYEWVEAPNTHGMALFADGGIMATKPYAASGAYINKMSDYCKSCRYQVSVRNGPKACPFNYLYWNFLMENEDRLKGNQRLSMIYKTLERMDEDKRRAVREDSARFLRRIGIETQKVSA